MSQKCPRAARAQQHQITIPVENCTERLPCDCTAATRWHAFRMFHSFHSAHLCPGTWFAVLQCPASKAPRMQNRPVNQHQPTRLVPSDPALIFWCHLMSSLQLRETPEYSSQLCSENSLNCFNASRCFQILFDSFRFNQFNNSVSKIWGCCLLRILPRQTSAQHFPRGHWHPLRWPPRSGDLWSVTVGKCVLVLQCFMFSHMSYMSYVNTQNPAVSKWTETALVRNVVRVDSYHLPEVFTCMICMALQLFANRNEKHGNTAAHIAFSTSVYKRASRFAISWMMCLDYLTTKSLICTFSIFFHVVGKLSLCQIVPENPLVDSVPERIS